jgi:dipeptidyl aminopeptidase/acylaminoacyl peptidase
LISPYTIEGLRNHEYESGKIHIGETLSKNESYTIYRIDYPSGGLRITGVMSVPVGDGPFPVIVMNHGYFNRDDFHSGDGTDRASEYLVRRGYITIASDYRSWGDSDIGPSFFYSGLAIDVINLLNAIPSVPQADPSRVGMWGHSMGGGVTMKVLAILGGRVVPSDNEERIAKFPEGETTVKAAVLYSTVSADNQDLVDRWGMGCFGDIAAGEDLYGCNSSDIIPDGLPRNLQDAYQFAANDSKTLKLTSPLYYLDSISIPVQIHYGTEDGKFFGGTPPEWSKKLYQGFVDVGKKNVELFGYDGEGHSFFADQWVAFMGRAGQFFDLYLK